MEKKNRYMAGMKPDEITLLKYIKSTVSEEERLWVDVWLEESKENEKVLLQLANIDYALRTKKRIESRNSERAYRLVERRIDCLYRKKLLNRFYEIAACFLGVLILSTVISYWMQKDVCVDRQMITVQANAGMRTNFTLPDGTVVYLNSGSVLSYPFPYDKDKRLVSLTGEAYFKVVHNKEQPFVVSVADDRMRVNVLGTEFNMQSYNDEAVVKTTLVSGAVNIEVLRNGNIVSEVNLKPSEKAVYDMVSGVVSISTVNTEYDTAWREGRLIFKDMPLPQVLKKLSYFYNVRFDVKDSVINSYHFTGTFQNKQLSQVLDYLKISSLIDYKIQHVVSDDSQEVQHATVVLRKRNY